MCWKPFRIRRTPLAALLLVALLGAPAIASAQIAVLGNPVEERTAAPGTSYVGTIVVKNLTDRPQPARIYQSDYSFFSDGTSHFDPPGSVGRSNAAWVTPSTSSIIIPPSGEMTVAYTVRVPAVDTLRGTYWSTIMVEGAPNVPHATSSRQMGLGTVMRYAVQLATHLSSSGSNKVGFAKQRFITQENGTESLELEVTNTGERGYRPLVWAELYDVKGTLLARRQQQRGLLYPGTSIKQTFDLGKLPHGAYKAIVFADTGDDTVVAAQYKVSF
ncbi:MAG: hypothetical protein H0W63_09185 [Gemmatimonadaceae bacterium]|nr:hypothetical protein [Gemmatimonadaceae bacterium]